MDTVTISMCPTEIGILQIFHQKEIICFWDMKIPIDELEGNGVKTIIQILMKYV